ncbi:Talin-1 [Nymphon striatum]|nr:Talin-1 [Nymphon striatum]
MAVLSLKVSIVEKGVVKTMQFEPSVMVYDACKIIRDKLQEASNLGQPKDYGLFLADEDPKKGVWLEQGRNFDYYLLREGDLLEYKRKMRALRVRMLDGSVKTLLVDDSQAVANLMVVICTKIGLTNHDEYSLVRDLPEEEPKEPYSTGTLTLRRKDKDKNQKMEQMKKKLKTDDDMNWVDHSKTLREQGIDESETLLLRRKFFFSDQNIDSRDPVQLNLLYVQARDAIIDGTHPVTLDQACQFAGMQCQTQFGDHVETKHKPGFLDLKELLPKEYCKNKTVEKRIFQEHKKYAGLTEIDAKSKYAALARSLKTYGVTFFLVKEKMRGKNKLAPRLLGITKDSVLRLDEKTKEILKTWPLTTVKRWAASPNSFTLDFGDYSDSYYSVQTPEGEQISQLISGYIDIILKKKRAKDHFGIAGDDGSTMVEDNVSPAKATILQHHTSNVEKPAEASVALPVVMRSGANGATPYGTGRMQAEQYGSLKGRALSAHHAPSPRALLSTIDSGKDAIKTAEIELMTKAQLPEIGTDPASQKWKEEQLEVEKQNVSSQIAAMNAATAQVVTLTSPALEEPDNAAVGAAISTISSNLPEMSRGVKMIAALMEPEPDGEKLLDATRKLCNAFSDLLKAAEPENTGLRQELLNAASKVGEATLAVLQCIGEEDAADKETQDLILGLAKAVANATATLVLKSKDVAAKCEDQALQNKVITSATQCALATSQLVACSKVVAPTIASPACQQQLIDAAKEVAKAVEDIVGVCQMACKDDKTLRDLGAAATAVTQALNDLLMQIKVGTKRAKEGTEDGHVDTILVATDKLFSSEGDAGEMVRQAKILEKATANLVFSIKSQADAQPDSEIQMRLLNAARVLAFATTKMVEAAKGCASNPHDSKQQEILKRAAEDVRSATNVAAGNALRKKVVKRLESSAKHAAAMASQNVTAAHNATLYSTNKASQDELLNDCYKVTEIITSVAHGVSRSMSNPDNAGSQLELIIACEELIHPCSEMITSSKAAIPTITSQSASRQLDNTSKELSGALTDLRTSLSKTREATGGIEIDSAIDIVKELDDEIAAFQRAANMNELKPLPGETEETCTNHLGVQSKVVGSSMAQLLTAACQGNENYTGMAARDTANALKNLKDTVRGVAATTSDKDVQNKILANSRDVMCQSVKLIEESRKSINYPNDPNNVHHLSNVAKSVSNALNNCIGCLPGQKDVDESICSITEASQSLNSIDLPQNNKPYSKLQTELSSAASNLNSAAGNVVTSARKSTSELATSSKRYTTVFHTLLNSGMEVAGSTSDIEIRSQMVSSMKSVSMVSSKLLVTAKSVSADPHAPNAKNQLSSAARAVTDSINTLLDVCTQSAPGQKECDNAIRNIESMRNMLDNLTEPVNDASFFECLDSVMERSKKLGESMSGIANHAKKGEHQPFGKSVKGVSDSVCGLIEAAAQAAYLVGVSDPSSSSGRPGLVDQTQFARASQAIQMACQNLTKPNCSQQEVLSAATVIAKHTSSLCNACRMASAKTTNPVAKRHFVQSAKDVANATANLVKEIKALDQENNDKNRQNCGIATRPLVEAVENLTTFASSAEFATIPAKISTQARISQEPITSSARCIIDGSCNMLTAAKSLAVNPKEPPIWQSLANHSRNVSDSIKSLVSSIKDKSPGQRECDQAVEKLSENIKELDQASLSIISHNISPRRGNTFKGYQHQMETSATEILGKIDVVKSAAIGEAEKLGHSVSQMISYFDPLITGAIGSASNSGNHKQQMSLLDQTKTITESGLQLVYAAKEGGGNPKVSSSQANASGIHGDIDESSEAMKEAVQDLLRTLENAATEAGVVTGLVDQITKSIAMVDERHIGVSEGSFVDYQTRMVNSAKELARISQDMVAKSSTDVAQLGHLGATLSHNYTRLANDARGAMAATSNSEVGQRVRSSVQDLGNSCISLVKAGGACQSNPGDIYSQRDVTDNAHHVSEKVSFVLAALQAGSRGTQACINAASTVSGIIGDLDTTIMFATAGTLHAENDDEAFSDHRENILKTAKALVEDTKTLVAGAASSQEQLAVAAQNAVTTIVQLAEVVKLGAASLGSNNPEAQVLLINAVKDVASALGDLIHATKSASGKSINDPAMLHLKDSAKVMVTNVTSLLKTVKTVEDEHARGTRALEATIEAIGQEIRAFDSSDPPPRKATAEELIRCTKPVTLATAKAVAAGNSGKQDDIIVASNMGRKAIFDLLTISKGAAYSAEVREIKIKTMTAGADCATRYRELLQMVHSVILKPTSEGKLNLVSMSRNIAQAVTEIVNAAESLKGEDWVDPDDPTVIAENELLGAAASIDAAAKKLSILRPRRTSIKSADEEMNFDEMILEAAKSIAAATSALVKAASAAQRELVATGRVGARPLFTSDDGQWSEGLISAARLVAAATHSLCEAANSLVQGHATEERLISSAKQVASSTAHLLVACQVKADPNSTTMKRLQVAGNAVKRATDNLVKSAQSSIEHDEERTIVIQKSMVGMISCEITARAEILRKERELEEAREKLTAIRRAKYQSKPVEDGEFTGYGSDL